MACELGPAWALCFCLQPSPVIGLLPDSARLFCVLPFEFLYLLSVISQYICNFTVRLFQVHNEILNK